MVCTQPFDLLGKQQRNPPTTPLKSPDDRTAAQDAAASRHADATLLARLKGYELAAKMQTSIHEQAGMLTRT